MPGTDLKQYDIAQPRLCENGLANEVVSIVGQKSSGCMRSLLHQLSAFPLINPSPGHASGTNDAGTHGTVISPLRIEARASIIVVAWGPFFRTPKPLLGLVRRQKLGIDPALPAGVLDLDPIPLPACSCELRAPGGSPDNGRVCGGGRPDVDAGTLQKDEIRVLRRGCALGRHSLGRSRGGERSSNIARRNHTGRSGRWLSHSRSRLHLSLG